MEKAFQNVLVQKFSPVLFLQNVKLENAKKSLFYKVKIKAWALTAWKFITSESCETEISE